ncbi:transcription factor pcc1 protein [Nannochloropsis oceanica]
MASLEDPEATRHHCHIDLHFPTPAKAQLVKNVLEIDDELQPTKIRKTFAVDGTALDVLLVSCDPKVLRVAVSSFYDMLTVALKTLQEFDEK